MKVVSATADFRVETVSHIADLKVEKVNMAPNSCGQWEFVDVLPGFKIELVNMFSGVQ